MVSERSFLFLQSLPARFFERLGAALAARGHGVYRINFNGGDRAFWRLPNGVDFRRRACEDILYYLASTAEMWRFPHYRTHRPYYQAVEYAGWARRLLLRRRSERRAAAEIAALRGDPRYFFPLQLDCDSQMRVHSPFRATHLAIDHVLSSFAAHAPSTARLIVKLHPMDSGLVDWAGMVGHLAAEYLVAERVTVLDGGDLPKVLAGADAVVTVNSTVGAQAVARGLPVIALGKAVYDMPGLTYQGGLDDFWTDARPPDPSLFDAVRRVLAARAMIPGSFFNEAGLRLAVAVQLPVADTAGATFAAGS